MTDPSKIKPSHTQRAAYVYIRQSTPGQVEHNRESTARQYALADRACQLGWAKEQVVIIDEDLGLSGSGTDKRSGFARLTSEVALAHVGIVLGLEVSRLARNNADWYRLLELCGITDTLIGDNDGVYHPALFNDRLLLGLKGTMSEAELHIIRARLDGGIRNKAARGELRRGLPVGLVWGEQDGEVLFHPDEAVTGAIRTVFERFAELGSARRVWLWFRSEGLSFPLQTTPAGMPGPIRWVAPTYHALHQVLTNPVYAGAYTYGKTQLRTLRRCTRRGQETDSASAHGTVGRSHPDHHPGFIDWATFEANQARLDSNTTPHAAPGGRRGERRLGAVAGHRHLRTLRPPPACSLSRPELDSGLSLRGKDLVNGRGVYCLNVGGIVIEQAVADAFLQAITPAAIEATRLSLEQLQANHDAALSQWRLEVERARYEAERAERRYRTVEPENRLVARGLETEWENRLRDLAAAEMELRRREQQRPSTSAPSNSRRFRGSAPTFVRCGRAATTTDRDRKELLRTLLEEVVLNLKRAEGHAHLTLRWRGGALPHWMSLSRSSSRWDRARMKTRSLCCAAWPRLYPDEVIAGILNRQGRKTATGERFTANQVGSLRRYRDIPRFQPPARRRMENWFPFAKRRRFWE